MHIFAFLGLVTPGYYQNLPVSLYREIDIYILIYTEKNSKHLKTSFSLSL